MELKPTKLDREKVLKIRLKNEVINSPLSKHSPDIRDNVLSNIDKMSEEDAKIFLDAYNSIRENFKGASN